MLKQNKQLVIILCVSIMFSIVRMLFQTVSFLSILFLIIYCFVVYYYDVTYKQGLLAVIGLVLILAFAKSLLISDLAVNLGDSIFIILLVAVVQIFREKNVDT